MRFLADENFDNRILNGLRSALPDLDIVRAQDTEISGARDPDLLEWAATQERILITHDIRTIPQFVADRLTSGLPMPGVIIVQSDLAIGTAIHELSILIEAGKHEDFVDMVCYVPIH